MGTAQLVVVQPTPFCNIDCSYCYLPTRSDPRRMRIDTVAAIARNLATDGLLSPQTTIVWHAGEPLVVGRDFYREATQALAQHWPAGVAVRQTFQTNGTLVDQHWCDLFLEVGAKVGLSLDGPERLHDARRVTRAGRGTFRRVRDALSLLQSNRVPHYVLAVLTRSSLDAPDEMFQFFLDAGVTDLGFNVEEIEGVHRYSSLQADGAVHAFRDFFTRFYELADGSPLSVRELRNTRAALLGANLERAPGTQQLVPYRIVTVDSAGGFSTFSPELLGMTGPPEGDFVIGNVHEIGFIEALQSSKFKSIHAAIQEGVSLCQASCEFFQVCGGGSPSNKLAENGSLVSTETMFCRFRFKELTEIVLQRLERSVPRSTPPQ